MSQDDYKRSIAFADSLISNNQFQGASKIYQLLYEKRFTLTSLDSRVWVVNEFGVLNLRLGNYSKAKEIFSSFDQTLNITDKYRTRLFNGLGLSYLNLDIYDSAAISYILGLELAENTSESFNYSYLYNNLGLVHKEMGLYSESILRYHQAVEINERFNDLNGQASALSNIGEVFYRQSKNDSAQYYFLKALNFQVKTENIRGQLITLVNLANIQSRFGNKRKALEILWKCKALTERVNNSYIDEVITKNIGDFHLDLNQFDSAKIYFNRSLDLQKSTGSRNMAIETYEGLSELAEKSGNPVEALDYFKKHTQLKDSVKNVEIGTAILEIETKYETEKKDKEILQLENTQQVQEITLAKNKITQYGMVGALALLLLGGGFFWKDRQRRLLLEKYKAEEAEKNRIARELHDGIANELLSIGESLTGESELQKERLLEADQELRKFAHQLETKRKFESILTDIFSDYISHGRFDNRLDVKVDFFPRAFDLENRELKLNIFRIWQELLSNTIKHSKADQCFFQLAYSGKKLEVSYQDNGNGLTKDDIGEGIGLRNIEERVSLLKGNMHFTNEDAGFGINIVLPVKKSQIKFT